jgi:hypothetical protein
MDAHDRPPPGQHLVGDAARWAQYRVRSIDP